MPARPIRVLVVDDDDAVRRSLCAYLEDEGYAVMQTPTGEAALALLAQAAADIGIIDIRLPGIDGDAVIAHAHRLRPAMQFLIHTGSRSYQLSPELVALGLEPADVFSKPLADVADIARAVRRKAGP
jgi:DNA-binding NtrC family response regulator